MRDILTIVLVMLTASCGSRNPQATSNLKIDISVPTNQINSQSIIDLVRSLETMVQSNSEGTLNLEELIAVIPFTDSEMAKIQQHREGHATVSCVNSVCTGTNRGTSLEIDASQMNLPTIGVPHVRIADNIRFKFRMGRQNVLDICSIEGFAVKKLVFWSDIHAAQVLIDNQTTVTRAVITASPTGYTRCE